MNFVIFNTVLFCISYIIDYIAIDWFGLVQWSSKYINYLLFVNFPISSIATYLIIDKVKEFLGLDA
jgi:hypothetical protein